MQLQLSNASRKFYAHFQCSNRNRMDSMNECVWGVCGFRFCIYIFFLYWFSISSKNRKATHYYCCMCIIKLQDIGNKLTTKTTAQHNPMHLCLYLRIFSRTIYVYIVDAHQPTNHMHIKIPFRRNEIMF